MRRYVLDQARKRTESKVKREDYPAPFRALEAIEAALTQELPQGLDFEARLVGEDGRPLAGPGAAAFLVRRAAARATVAMIGADEPIVRKYLALLSLPTASSLQISNAVLSRVCSAVIAAARL